MFNLISRDVDYPLQSILGFDVHKVALEPLALQEPSLTLLSKLNTTGEALLALSKKDKNETQKDSEQSIEKIAHHVENLLYQQHYNIKLNTVKVHSIDDDLNKIISTNNLSTLNSQYVFLENSISAIPVDLYETIFEIQSKNLVPVLNFPEKDPHFNSKNQRLLRLKDRGCVFHIDLLSLSGHNGHEAKQVASSLLQSNQVHFVSFQVQALAKIRESNGIKVSRKIANLLDEQLFQNTFL